MRDYRSNIRRLYVDVAHRQMHARVSGTAVTSDRPPVLCLHMSPYSGRVYEDLIEQLGSDRMAMAPDTPGFGYSDPPPAPPSIEDYADSMAGFLDAMGIDAPVDLFGYHTGSMIALALANRHPERVRRIITVAMSIRTDAERAEARDLYRQPVVRPDGSHLAEMWQGYLKWQLAGGSTIDAAADGFPCRLLGRANSWWGHRAAFDFAPERWLPQTRQPILIINAGDDLTVYTSRAQAHLADGRLLEAPYWGHSYINHHAADAAALARRFYDADDTDPFDAAMAVSAPQA